MSSLPSELTLLSMDRGKKESQATHCVSGGTPSLPSALCACDSSSSFPSNIAKQLNQGIPKLMFTQLGKRRGRKWCFILSPPSITLQVWVAGDWGTTEQEWGWRNRAPKQARTSRGGMMWDWYWDWVAGWTWWLNDCMHMAAGREHFAFSSSSNFNTALKHRERNEIYFPWSKTKYLARQPKPRCTELAVLL